MSRDLLKCVRGQGPYVFTALPSVSLKFSVPDFQSKRTNIKEGKLFLFFLLEILFRILNFSVIFLNLLYIYSFLNSSLFPLVPTFPYHLLPHSTCWTCIWKEIGTHACVAWYSILYWIFGNCTHISLVVRCPFWWKMALPSFLTSLCHCPNQHLISREKSVQISKTEDATSLRKMWKKMITFWK